MKVHLLREENGVVSAFWQFADEVVPDTQRVAVFEVGELLDTHLDVLSATARNLDVTKALEWCHLLDLTFSEPEMEIGGLLALIFLLGRLSVLDEQRKLGEEALKIMRENEVCV
jgi:hypothetical protein